MYACADDHLHMHRGKRRKKSQTYPKLASKHDNFPSRLLFAEAPLHQVLPTLPRQAHVASGYSWVGSTCQDVGLRLVVGVHAVGIGNPQRVVKANLITTSTLVC